MKKAKKTHLVEFIDQYQDKHGFSPSIRDIGDALGYSSTSGVVNLLNKVEIDGLIKRDAYIPRSVRLTPAGEKLLAATKEHD